MSRALSHFLDLALRGRGRGCSGGCVAARNLATGVAHWLPCLDSLARDGLREFINLASNSPGTARDLLKGEDDDEG